MHLMQFLMLRKKERNWITVACEIRDIFKLNVKVVLNDIRFILFQKCIMRWYYWIYCMVIGAQKFNFIDQYVVIPDAPNPLTKILQINENFPFSFLCNIIHSYFIIQHKMILWKIGFRILLQFFISHLMHTLQNSINIEYDIKMINE